MAAARDRLERIISEFIIRHSGKLLRKWRTTSFEKLVPDARRRSTLFRRVLAEAPAIQSTLDELVAERSLTPSRLLDRVTQKTRPKDEVSNSGTGAKANRKRQKRKMVLKRTATKKAAPKKAPLEKSAVREERRSFGKRGRGSARGYGSYGGGAGGGGGWTGAASKRARKSAHSVVRIFYATDRKPLATLSGVRFGPGREASGQLSFGTCLVSIPKRHRTGHLESPSYLRLEFRPNPDKHIALLEMTTLEEDQFLKTVSESVARSPAKDAVIFVHGYNVTFEDAARRTGQIAFDLKFVGAPILYSWPANGSVLDYPADEATVIWTAPHFERFLRLIAARSGATRIHVIAHSMGNRAVCDALKAISSKPDNPEVLLSHLVLAAPDMDADTFRELALALRRVSRFVTVYVSSSDRAIKLSQTIHRAPRAGAPPPIIVPGVDSIDASQLGADWLAHSYFTDNWPALSDIHALLSTDTPAAERFGLNALSSELGTYFVFRV